MCNCPTIGDLFCAFFNCFSCGESQCEQKCSPKHEHKEERCEKRFECVCREHHDERKEDCRPCEKEHEDSCDRCACRVK